MAERAPERSQQATLRALGDDALRELVERYVTAWQDEDVDAIVAMLTEDATFAMPPRPEWYRGREAIGAFLRRHPLSGDGRLEARAGAAQRPDGLHRLLSPTGACTGRRCSTSRRPAAIAAVTSFHV